MNEDRIVLRLNLVVVLLCVIAFILAIPYFLFVFDNFPNFFLAVITALTTMVGFILFQAFRGI